MVKAVVVRAAGTNCDYETMHCLKLAGFKPELVHVNEFIKKKRKLPEFSMLVVPGGFSFGDYMGSGKVFANKFSLRMNRDIADFIARGNLVLGICNGFQVLVKAGILPGFENNYNKQLTTLTFNNSGRFQDEWVRLNTVKKNNCVFAEGIESIACPINHGEGKFIPESRDVLKKLYANGQVVFKYEKNPNGSTDDIAGISDQTGRVLGLMPHPEKHFTSQNSPLSTRLDLKEEGEGLQIFRNAFGYLKK